MERTTIDVKENKLMDLLNLLGAALAGLVGLAFVGLLVTLVVLIALGLLRGIFGFKIAEFWQAYFVNPTDSWLKQLLIYSGGDVGITIVLFGFTIIVLHILINSPSLLIFSSAIVNWHRSAVRKGNTTEWKVTHNRLSLLFGDDIEELALYERRILPANTGAEAAANPGPWSFVVRVFGILRLTAKILYVPFSWMLSFGFALAFFDAIKRAFEQNDSGFFPPVGGGGGMPAPDHFGFAAMNEWTIIAIIAVATVVLTIAINKARSTFQWPTNSFRNATIAVIVIVVTLKLMLSKPLLFFAAACVVSSSAITLLWRWILRPVLLRVRSTWAN